jgi:hypothetical protein
MMLSAFYLNDSASCRVAVLCGAWLTNPFRTKVTLTDTLGSMEFDNARVDYQTGVGLRFGGRWQWWLDRVQPFLEVYMDVKLRMDYVTVGPHVQNPASQWDLNAGRFAFGVNTGLTLFR